MNLLPMKYFLTVVEKQSISKAAAALHVTQQTLSAHIAAIEQELSCRLFDRRPCFRLTHAGTVFFQYCLQFVHLDEAMHSEFHDLALEDSGVFKIGLAHTRSRILMPRLVGAYRRKFPLMQVQVREAMNATLVEELLAGELDLIIGHLPEELPELKSTRLYEEQMMLAVPLSLASQETLEAFQKSLDLSLFSDAPFLLNYDGDIVGRSSLILLKKAQIVPKVAAKSDNIEMILDLCARGEGLCFCTDVLAFNYFQKETLKRIAMIPLEERFSIHAAWQNKSYISRRISEFVTLCRQLLS